MLGAILVALVLGLCLPTCVSGTHQPPGEAAPDPDDDGDDPSGYDITDIKPNGPLTMEERATLCALWTGCEEQYFIETCLDDLTALDHFGATVWGSSAFSVPRPIPFFAVPWLESDCILAAQGCAEVIACAAEYALEDVPTTDGCDGDRLLVDVIGGQYAIPCGRFGLTCATSSTPTGETESTCAIGACSDAEENHCNGDVAERCLSGADGAGALVATDCAAFGVACIDGTCVGDGGECMAGLFRCDGDDMVVCAGGREARFDCARRNDTCNSAGGACGRIGDDTCDDGVITAATAEGPVDVDCTVLGFSTCGVNGTWVRCLL